MKKFLALIAAVSSLGLAPAFAQLGMGGGGMGPQYDGSMNKLFGDNHAFSARLQIQSNTGDSNTVSTTGKLSFDNGKSRFDMNIGDVQGSIISPEAVQQMKMLGMDQTVFISRPDLKATYLVYPTLSSYIQVSSSDTSGTSNPDDYKLEVTADGKETLDGHDCAKNNAIVTDKEGKKHHFTIWNATDLKNFPLKVFTDDGGRPTTMLYQNVSFTAPEASLFNPPTGYSKYDSPQAMVQAALMKKYSSGGAAAAPGQQ